MKIPIAEAKKTVPGDVQQELLTCRLKDLQLFYPALRVVRPKRPAVLHQDRGLRAEHLNPPLLDFVYVALAVNVLPSPLPYERPVNFFTLSVTVQMLR